MQDSPHGGSGDASRGDGSSPRVVVESFHTKKRLIPAAYDLPGMVPLPVVAYYTGGVDGSFMLGFGMPGQGSSTDIWTTEAGVEAVRDACNVALVTARIAREAAA